MAKGLLPKAIDIRKNREKERQRKIREATGGATPQSNKAASKRRTKRKA